MFFLELNHIIDLYCWVDDLLPKQLFKKTGRPILISDSELITFLIWNTIVLKQKNLKDIWGALNMYHKKDFPMPPKYSSFIDHCHKVLPKLIDLLEIILQPGDVGIVDSTMLEVCKLYRAEDHKVAKI